VPFPICAYVKDGEAGIAGGEGAFSLEGGRELRGWDRSPGLAVGRDEKLEFELAGIVGDGIAEDDAVGGIPESDGVEKGFGIGAGELEVPVLAGVDGVVDAGLVAGSGGHEKSFVGGEGDDAAEIEIGGVGDLGGDPGTAGVGGAEVGAVGTGGPGDLQGDGADAAKIFRGVRGLSLTRGLSQRSGSEKKSEEDRG